MPAASNSISLLPSTPPSLHIPSLFSFPPSPPLSSFLPLLVYSVAMATPSRSRHVVEEPVRVPLLRSPDAGRLHRRPLSHGIIVQFGFDNVCAPHSAVAEECSQPILSPNVELLQFYRPGVLERTPLNSRKKNINRSLLSNFHEESLVKAV